MENQIFRKKTMDRIASPEQLNDYIRISNPGAWLVLTAVVVLLIGVCVWSVFGRIHTGVPGVAVAENGQITLYLSRESAGRVEQGMEVQIGEDAFSVSSVSPEPVPAAEGLGEYAMHLGEFQKDQWICPLEVSGTLEDGTYPAKVIVESIAPMAFVFD